MGAPPPQPARRRASAGPPSSSKPRQGPVLDPGLQFSMDGMDDAPDASAADAMPVKMQVSARRRRATGRRSGRQQRLRSGSIPDGSPASPRERAEKKRGARREQIGLGDAVALGVAVDVARADGGAGVCARGRPAADDAAAEDFQLGRRVFLHFGHGHVASLGLADAAAARPAARAAEEGARADGAHPHINVVFDNPQHKQARARAILRRAIPRRAIRRRPSRTRCARAPSTPCRRWW